MSIMDMFRNVVQGAQAQQQQQPAGVTQPNTAPSTPGNMPANAAATSAPTAGAAANGVVPPGTDVTSPEQSSLDPFKDFWNTDPNKKPADTGIFNFDTTKLQEVASKENFAAAINPELMQKINAGGPDAMKAMVEVMNTMAQQVYFKSAAAATRLSEHAATTTASRLKEELPSTFKNLQVSERLTESNPAFNNPAVQPLIELVKHQAQQKYPNATAAEIQKHATDYLSTVFSAIVPQSANGNSAQSSNKKSEDTDWSTFL